jgi:hypothetical protein
MPEPMNDASLVEIEALIGDLPDNGVDERWEQIGLSALVLLAEVRRLRRALQLSEASRGVPSGVGRD